MFCRNDLYNLLTENSSRFWGGMVSTTGENVTSLRCLSIKAFDMWYDTKCGLSEKNSYYWTDAIWYFQNVYFLGTFFLFINILSYNYNTIRLILSCGGWSNISASRVYRLEIFEEIYELFRIIALDTFL